MLVRPGLAPKGFEVDKCEVAGRPLIERHSEVIE